MAFTDVGAVIVVVAAAVVMVMFPVDSELLQALDLCDNDPVAVARCFVMKASHQNAVCLSDFYFEKK